MTYNAKFETLDDFVQVTVSGSRIQGQEVADAIGVWSQVADYCREAKIVKILAILQLEGRLPTMDAYEIVARAEEFGWSHSLRLALVDTNTESLEDNLFTETVAVNRAYPIKVFDDIAAAKTWLLTA